VAIGKEINIKTDDNAKLTKSNCSSLEAQNKTHGNGNATSPPPPTMTLQAGSFPLMSSTPLSLFSSTFATSTSSLPFVSGTTGPLTPPELSESSVVESATAATASCTVEKTSLSFLILDQPNVIVSQAVFAAK
jgi:hypothetical protein